MLKKLASNGVKDSIIIYLEFKDMYGSIDELMSEVLKQVLYRLYKVYGLKDYIGIFLKNVVRVLSERVVGIDFSSVLEEDIVRDYLRKKPLVVLENAIRELCRISSSFNKRLVLIFDEFHVLTRLGSGSFSDRIAMLLHYLSKTQEWGFEGVDGYPIYILSTSDYAYYRYMSYAAYYIESYYLDELDRGSTIELLEALSREYGVSISSGVVERVVEDLGGNPGLIIWFIQKLVLNNIVRLDSIDTYNKMIEPMVREYYTTYIVGMSLSEKELVKKIWRVVMEKGYVSIDELSVMVGDKWSIVDDLLHRNILQIRQYKIMPQNKLIDKVFRKYLF